MLILVVFLTTQHPALSRRSSCDTYPKFTRYIASTYESSGLSRLDV